MNAQHIFLIILWIVYALLHSLLATAGIKCFMQQQFGNKSRYYRFLYSFFATVSLIAVLYYHFSIATVMFWNATIFQKATGFCVGATGVILMLICARIYFVEMTGINAFFQKNTGIGLVKTGLHKYMRHPLYTGTLLLMWAFFVYAPSEKNLITCGINTMYVLIGIRLEERKLIASFGDGYLKYISETPMLIPGLK